MYIVNLWLNFYDEIPLLSKLYGPYIGAYSNLSATLIYFADSSIVGYYSAIVFIKVIMENGDIKINLLCTKSIVAPVNAYTIPRPEPCAAVLLSELIKTIIATYLSRIKIEHIYVHSDSTVVLNWIASSLYGWKTCC